MLEYLYLEAEFAQLKEQLHEQFSPLYAINDKAHQIDHVVDVCDRALDINELFGLGLDRRMVVISAMCHDLFTWSRSNHHLLAEQYLLTVREPWLVGFTSEDRRLMGAACREHRASWKGGYTSMLSELIATADRGVPGNLEEMIWRCYLYGRDKLGEPHDIALGRIIPHLVAKHCKPDYGNNPPLYEKVYGVKLKQQQQLLEELTMESPLLQNLEERYNASF